MGDWARKRKTRGTIRRDNDTLTHMLGSFIMSWSTFESIIDAAIIKRLGTTRFKGAIVVSDLGILARVGILKSLLDLQTDKQQSALATIGKIQELARRNTLMHATIHLTGGTLEFIKLEAKTGLKAKLVEYKPEKFAEKNQQDERPDGRSKKSAWRFRARPNVHFKNGQETSSQSSMSPSPPSRKSPELSPYQST